MDIQHGQIGLSVQHPVVGVLKQEVADATIHLLQGLMQEIVHTCGQVWNQENGT